MAPKSSFEINWPLWAILAYFAQPMRRKVLSVLFFFLFSRKKDDSLASAERSMARSVKRMSAESAQILCMTNVDTYAYKAARGSLAPRWRRGGRLNLSDARAIVAAARMAFRIVVVTWRKADWKSRKKHPGHRPADYDGGGGAHWAVGRWQMGS